MVRHYKQIPDNLRATLIKLIHEDGLSIATAAKRLHIQYDNAKAINRTYTKEKRIKKIDYN